MGEEKTVPKDDKSDSKQSENKPMKGKSNSKTGWIIGGIVTAVILVVAIAAFVMMSSGGTRESLEGLTEEEKYIQFQAEVACEVYEMTADIDENDPDAGMEVFGQMILLMQTKAQEYGYSEEDFQNLSMKYDSDPAIQEKGQALMADMCPDAYAEMQAQESST